MPETLSHTSSLATLRDTDRDRYLATLLAPENKREALASIYAFNAEIARIRDSVREPLPGELRMQWWRDLLDGNPHGDSHAHPVAAALLQTIDTYSLPRQTFIDLIDARIFDLYDDAFNDMNSLEGYAGETASALIQLSSLVLSPNDAAKATEAAGHGGVAQAMAGILLLLPYHQRRGQLFIPLDILNAVGLDRQEFLAGESKEKISAAIDIFIAKAAEHLQKARKVKIPHELVPAYNSLSLLEPVLLKAKKLGAGLLTEELQMSQLKRQWILLKANFFKRF